MQSSYTGPGESSTVLRAHRASKACARCRRYRTRCQPGPLNDTPPCQQCFVSGTVNECIFMPRGHSYADRSHRRRRPTSQSSTAPVTPTQFKTANASPLESLPPEHAVIEAVDNYISSYFQVGFIHKPLFIDNYRRDPSKTSSLLLLAICSVAAPFSPSLSEKYGGRSRATCHFLDQANKIAAEEMLLPTLERAQAFLLLGVAEWGQGNGQKAWMLIGIASRMAGFLGLHREATYSLPPDADSSSIIDMEISRRTFWAIICHESLLAGQGRPSFFNLAEIDARLPCDESDFNFGIEPPFRSTLAGSMSERVVDGGSSRSLFSSLVQAHILWSLTARHASREPKDQGGAVWTGDSQFLLQTLCDYEANLPPKHRFSESNLRGMIAEGHDLPFLTLSILPKLSTIVIRRIHLSSMTAAAQSDYHHQLSPGGQPFWKAMSSQMVFEAEELLNHVETYIKMRSPTLVFPPVFMFAIFMCANVFGYLRKWPELCPSRSVIALHVFSRCKEILRLSSEAWAMGNKWVETLEVVEGNVSRPMRSMPIRHRGETLDEDLEPLYGDRANSRLARTNGDITSPTNGMGHGSYKASQQADFSQASDTVMPIASQVDDSSPHQEFDFGAFFGPFDDDLDALLMSFTADDSI